MERRRGSSATRADSLRFLILHRVPAALLRRWPLAWAVSHLCASALGGWAADSLPDPTVPLGYVGLVRTAALAPLLGIVRKPAAQYWAWFLVLTLSFCAGSLETRERRARVSAAADSPWLPAREVAGSGAAAVRVTGWPAAGNGASWRAPGRLLAWVAADTNGPSPGTGDGLTVRGEGPLPQPGDLLAGALTLRTPPRSSAPGGFDYRAFLAGRGLRWSARLETAEPVPGEDPIRFVGREVVAPVRQAILDQLARLYPGREAGLAGAVLLGRRTRDSRDAAEPFADLGLAHLFSVSGLHVGILLGMILLPGRWLALPPGARVLPLALTLPLYVVLTGLPGSVVRAAGLGWLAVCATATGRRADALHWVGCLFWLGSLWDPWQNLDTGLRLSYLAAGGILALASTAERNGLLGSGPVRWVAGGLLVSLSAQWFTLPVVAASFGRISLLSPAANLVAVPLFGAALWLVVLSLLCAAVWPWLGEAIAAVAWAILRVLAGAVQGAGLATGGWIVGLPVPGPGRIALLAGMTVLLLAIVYGRWGHPWSPARRLTAVLSLLAIGFGVVAPASPGSRPAAECWILDVGQGDCVLVRLGDGWTALIDTGGRFGRSPTADGPFSRTVLPFLERRRLHRIDALVLTHDHLDHTGGMAAALEALDVGEVYCGGRSERSLARVDSTRRGREPSRGEVLHAWDDWDLTVLYGAENAPPDFHENDRSTVVGLRRAGRTIAVFSGDLELDGEALWQAESGFPQGVEVWKAGHHGSNTSGSRGLLAAARPDVVVVSCGVGNGYGHPNHGPYLVGQDTLRIRRTDLDGTVGVTWDQAGNRRVRYYGDASSRGRLDTAPGRF